MEYLKLFEELQNKEIRYLICGGLAVNIYGIPRMTADIDLLIDFKEENILHFENALKAFNYKAVLPFKLSSLKDSEVRKKMKEEKNLIAFSFYNAYTNMMSIDILLDVPLSFETMWENKTVRKIEGTEINLVSLEHLITMKEYSGRVQDKQDIVHLKKFMK
jgi:predicted nucleotidyltransferase